MERRGFFGALMGVLALPFVWLKYPPVTRMPQYAVDHPKWETETCLPERNAKEGEVFKFFIPADDPPDPEDVGGWEVFIKPYYVAGHKPDSSLPGVAIRVFHIVHHRPTWAEVRELLARKAKS